MQHSRYSRYSRYSKGPPVSRWCAIDSNMTAALLWKAALFILGCACHCRVASTDFDRLISGYCLIWAYRLIGGPLLHVILAKTSPIGGAPNPTKHPTPLNFSCKVRVRFRNTFLSRTSAVSSTFFRADTHLCKLALHRPLVFTHGLIGSRHV